MSHGWAGEHARLRMKERWGVELDDAQWEAIVENAKAGNYRPHPDQSTNTAHMVAMVPMGNPDGEVHYVSMVINMKLGIVVTVLAPEA